MEFWIFTIVPMWVLVHPRHSTHSKERRQSRAIRIKMKTSNTKSQFQIWYKGGTHIEMLNLIHFKNKGMSSPTYQPNEVPSIHFWLHLYQPHLSNPKQRLSKTKKRNSNACYFIMQWFL